LARQAFLRIANIIHATDSLKKYTAPALTLPYSNFPATPAIPTALEIEPANSVATADTRRANQETPPGTALAANGRCGKDWNFIHVSQQLGARHHLPISQNDKDDSRISWLHTTPTRSEKAKPRFILFEVQNF
jgi:hypothetical protein